MKPFLSVFRKIGKKPPPTPKDRVRHLVETASGHQWSVKHESDTTLEYASLTSTTPGLCIFSGGKATLSPETRLVNFDRDHSDFSFDDAPEEVSVFSGKELDDDALRSTFKSFLFRWLGEHDWRLFEETSDKSAAKSWMRWVFTHNEGRPPPIALGELSLEHMPSAFQLNIERLCAVTEEDRKNADKPMPGKFKVCFSMVC
jgi:hypothetical protein